MKTATVDDGLYAALESEAAKSGRMVQELVAEAIEAWLADAAIDEAEHDLIEASRIEAMEQGGIEFETFFADLLQDED